VLVSGAQVRSWGEGVGRAAQGTPCVRAPEGRAPLGPASLWSSPVSSGRRSPGLCGDGNSHNTPGARAAWGRRLAPGDPGLWDADEVPTALRPAVLLPEQAPRHPTSHQPHKTLPSPISRLSGQPGCSQLLVRGVQRTSLLHPGAAASAEVGSLCAAREGEPADCPRGQRALLWRGHRTRHGRCGRQISETGTCRWTPSPGLLPLSGRD